MAKMHEYAVAVEWTGGRDGAGKVTGREQGINAALSTPPEFGGKGEGTNPEELLTAAVAGCYSITFGIIASNRKLPITNFHADAVGEVEENGPSFTYKKITVRPTITLSADATDDQIKAAEDMAHKADSYCIITNAIRGRVEIEVEPTVTRA